MKIKLFLKKNFLKNEKIFQKVLNWYFYNDRIALRKLRKEGIV
jgi:hypothetical protein